MDILPGSALPGGVVTAIACQHHYTGYAPVAIVPWGTHPCADVRAAQAVGGLASWFDNQVRPGAEPLNTGRTIPAGFTALATQFYWRPVG